MKDEVRFLLDRNFSLVPLSTKLKQGSYPKRCKTSRVAKPSWNDTDDMSLSLSRPVYERHYWEYFVL